MFMNPGLQGFGHPVSLDDILCTPLLASRKPSESSPALEAESFRRLARQLAHAPQELPQTVVEEALILCRVGSAGVSLLEPQPDGSVLFRWVAVAGQCAPLAGKSTPRDFSPCGACLDQNRPILFSLPARCFNYLAEAPAQIFEGLVLPLQADDRILGTIWIVAHDESRQFTSEDVRIMNGLADFASGALRLKLMSEEKAEVRRCHTETQQTLEEERRTFETALSNSPDFLYVFDLNGRFIYVNRALLELWQKSLDEALGKNFYDLSYPEDLANRLQRQIQMVIDTKEMVRDRTDFTSPSGETRHYEYIFVPVLDLDGTVEAVAGSTRDITQQKIAEDSISEDRQRWQALLAQTPAAIAILKGPNHTLSWVNTDFEVLVGRPANSLIGKPVLAAIPEAADQGLSVLLNGVYLTGIPFRVAQVLIRLGKEPKFLKDSYVNFAYLPTRDQQGVIDGIFVHATDVTEMVMARRQVEEREQQFRTLAESIPNLAWMARSDGHISWYNRRWYEYTAATPQAMEGWGWQAVHDPQILPTVMERWQESISSGLPFEMVFPIKGADGNFRDFLTRVEPVRDSQGSVVRWFGTNTDITEQRSIEQELRRINRELEEFAYVASHDLQEPLRMVNIYSHLLLEHVGVSDSKSEQFAGFIKTGVARMELLIRDLLTYSRTSQRNELPDATADLTDCLNETLLLLSSLIVENNAVIEFSELPTVRGDAGQLAHVFQNLFANSIKYRKTDVPPHITIWAEREEDNWKISVRDNGLGFEPRYAKKIFGLFQRLYSDEYPGTGLGLALCQRIIERYGGRIWAESEPGAGSTFCFLLPAEPAQ